MKKIPTMFLRNPEKMQLVLDQPNPACLWVFDGEGAATRKYDGTCCLVKGTTLFKRREIKDGALLPEQFIREDYDTATRKHFGWVPIDADNKEDCWHFEGVENNHLAVLENGTYELLGPKVQGNPEKFSKHTLLKHSNAEKYENVPRTFLELRSWIQDKDIEGLVFHHNDGRMAKIKKKDFGFKR